MEAYDITDFLMAMSKQFPIMCDIFRFPEFSTNV